MRGRRYTAPPLTSACSVVCQSYRRIITEGKKIRKRKADAGFHNPIGAFRGKAENRYGISSSISFREGKVEDVRASNDRVEAEVQDIKETIGNIGNSY